MRGNASPSGNSEAYSYRVTVAVEWRGDVKRRVVDPEVDIASNRSLHSSSYKKADAGTRVGAD